MGNKYLKTTDVFSTTENGAVPKPTAQEVSDNKFLRADGSWQTGGGGGGGATELNDLTDVALSALANGQLLKYDNGVFKNVNFADLLNTNSIKTQLESNSGKRLFSKYVGSAGDVGSGFTYFPLVKFTGGWQEVSGILFARSGVCIGTFMANASRGLHYNNMTSVEMLSGVTVPVFSYNSSTYILSIGLSSWEWGYFVGITNGELQ